MSATRSLRSSAQCDDARESHAAATAKTFFFVTGETDPGLLPRVLAPFAKMGLAPCRVHASTEHRTGEEMLVELRFTGLSAGEAERLAAKCRATVGVMSVMTLRDGG